ncbi:hypothetical protein Tco_0816868 [Tanacetum coccineum]
MKGGGVSFLNFLMIRYGSFQVKDSVWSERKDLFRLWVIDQFTEALDPDKDPLERCFDEYNWVFHKEIEQLADEYEIKIGEKGKFLKKYGQNVKELDVRIKVGGMITASCVSGENNETLSMGRKNGSRFRKMIMDEMEEALGNDGEDFDDETIQKLRGNYRDRLDSSSLGDKDLAGRRI